MSDPDGSVFESADIMRQIIRRPQDQQKGADIDEMRRGIRVLDALDKCDSSTLELEDADWEHLRDKARIMAWAIVDRRLLTVVEDVLDAQEKLTLNDEAYNHQVAVS
jgi:hypothetical protein